LDTKCTEFYKVMEEVFFDEDQEQPEMDPSGSLTNEFMSLPQKGKAIHAITVLKK